MEVKIEKITKEDEETVIEFLKDTFFKVSAGQSFLLVNGP